MSYLPEDGKAAPGFSGRLTKLGDHPTAPVDVSMVSPVAAYSYLNKWMLTVAINPSSHSMMLSCNLGVWPTSYCCGGDSLKNTSYNEDCCGKSFDVDPHPFGSPYAPAVGIPRFGAYHVYNQFTIANSTDQSENVSCNASTTAAPGNLSKPCVTTPSDHSVAVGVGVGVPLGLLFLTSLGLLFRERTRTKHVTMLLQEKNLALHESNKDDFRRYQYEASGPPWELGSTWQPGELHSIPMTEFPSKEAKRRPL